MGEVIRLAERREARRTRPRQRPARVRAEFLFDLACPFTYLAAERVERAFDDVCWTPASTTALRAGSLGTDAAALDAVRAAAERARRGAAAAARLARDLPRRRAGRDARRRPRRRVRPRRGVRAGRRPARVLRRLRPRRSRDPGRGGRGRRARRSRTACGPPAIAAATARSRPPGAACWRRAPTGCRRCGSAARCSGARSRSPRRPPPRGCTPPPRRASSPTRRRRPSSASTA